MTLAARRADEVAETAEAEPRSDRKLRSVDEEVPVLATASVVAVDGERRTTEVRLGARVVVARLDAALDPVVLETARARGERVIVERDAGEWVALGALLTCATPGVDIGDDYCIRARRVRVEAEHELTLTTGAARLALRAYGYVETLAHDITSRAASVHKIIGRIVNLN